MKSSLEPLCRVTQPKTKPFGHPCIHSSHLPVAADEHRLAGEHGVRAALEGVDDRLPLAVQRRAKIWALGCVISPSALAAKAESLNLWPIFCPSIPVVVVQAGLGDGVVRVHRRAGQLLALVRVLAPLVQPERCKIYSLYRTM